MKAFDDILSRSNNKIVIHHTCYIDDNAILASLHQNDLVFFDDCLYSQYVFLKKYAKILEDMSIACILGFSTLIFRQEQDTIFSVSSAELHDRVHLDDKTAFGGFMTLAEVKELASYSNIFIAGHGAKHLELSKLGLSKINLTVAFTKDISQMKFDLNSYGIHTDIFVFPYAYDEFPCANKLVSLYGFKYVFAGSHTQRISIEEITKQGKA